MVHKLCAIIGALNVVTGMDWLKDVKQQCNNVTFSFIGELEGWFLTQDLMNANKVV